jgi:hypothetical protein
MMARKAFKASKSALIVTLGPQEIRAARSENRKLTGSRPRLLMALTSWVEHHAFEFLVRSPIFIAYAAT